MRMSQDNVALSGIVILLTVGVLCFGLLIAQQPKVDAIRTKCKEHGGLYLNDYKQCVAVVQNWR